ncbi:voltage-gated potassium channel [Peribacillus deserti]|uniref:Voltage-gated potassium channel n=1 Tax=Peribacillus deserti TaxID=673318 RepID=A0ABS2QD09_9BACI|nr:two pore domain potassium channel family protein [Peribacillus deserti]MBM7691052.1 voltage-gated potassium channel [Peribacillus deserti]
MKLSNKKEFKKNRIYMYLFLNILLILVLTLTSVFEFKLENWNYVILTALLFMLLICIYLLYEFIVLIPSTSARMTNIFIGSGLLLCLILITYANLYLQVYMIKGGQAFTGKGLNGQDFLYYSITTFTTTGYGDITSVGLLSNSVAATEMLLGFISNTIFMAILTTKLVSKMK